MAKIGELQPIPHELDAFNLMVSRVYRKIFTFLVHQIFIIKNTVPLIQSYQSDDKKRMNESKRNLITFTSR